jgi:hypothetical protein
VEPKYVIVGNENLLKLAGTPILRQSIEADGGYLQAEYRLAPQWTLMARMDSFIAIVTTAAAASSRRRTPASIAGAGEPRFHDRCSLAAG